MSYGIKYKSEFTSELGVNYKVRILQKDYDSAITELVMGGEPVVINYNGDEKKFTTIRGSECVINFYPKVDYQFTEIVVADKNDFQVQVLKNDVLFWQGFVIQDNYNEPFMPLPYLVQLRATDGLGDLKFYDFKTSSNNVYINKITQIECVLACLSKLRNGTTLVTSNDIFESRIDRIDSTNESLNRIFINPFVYLKKGSEVSNCADVLKSILEIYNAYIYYKEGKYYIERINYKVQDTLTRRTYSINFDGASSTSCVVSTQNITANIGRNSALKFVSADANFTYQTPFKSLVIENDNNTPVGLTLNSQFINWNTGNTLPQYWESNGLNISKTGNTKSSSILQIDGRNNGTISAGSNNIKLPVYNFNSTINSGDYFKIKLAYFGNIRVAVKATVAGTPNYLIKSGDDYVWSTTFGTCTYQIPTGVYDPSRSYRPYDWRSDYWFTTEIKTPSLVADSIELFIYECYDVSGGYANSALIREFSTQFIVNNTNNYDGEKYVIDGGKKFTETYTDLDPVFGEFDSIGYSNQLLLNVGTGYTFTKNWSRDVITESKPLLQIAGTGVLNQYLTPFKNFSSSVKGSFDFGKIYSIDNLSGKFMPFKAQINLKNDVSRIDFFELLIEDSETLYTYKKTQLLGSGEYNSIPPKEDVDPNRPRPNSSRTR